MIFNVEAVEKAQKCDFIDFRFYINSSRTAHQNRQQHFSYSLIKASNALLLSWSFNGSEPQNTPALFLRSLSVNKQMKSGTARGFFYHLIRWLFFVSAASLALVFLIAVVVAAFDPTIPGAWEKGFVIVLIGGFAGLFFSVACANLV